MMMGQRCLIILTILFPVDIIKENYGHCTIETGIYALSSYYSRMDIGFIDGHTFYIAWKNLMELDPSIYITYLRNKIKSKSRNIIHISTFLNFLF